MKDKGKHCSIFINDTEVKYYPEADTILGFFGIDENDIDKHQSNGMWTKKESCFSAVELIRDRPDIALCLVAESIYDS